MGKQLNLDFDEVIEPVDIEKEIEQIKNVSAPLVLQNLARQAATSKNSQMLSLYVKFFLNWTEKDGLVIENKEGNPFDLSKLSDDEKRLWLSLAKKAKKDE